MGGMVGDIRSVMYGWRVCVLVEVWCKMGSDRMVVAGVRLWNHDRFDVGWLMMMRKTRERCCQMVNRCGKR